MLMNLTHHKYLIFLNKMNDVIFIVITLLMIMIVIYIFNKCINIHKTYCNYLYGKGKSNLKLLNSKNIDYDNHLSVSSKTPKNELPAGLSINSASITTDAKIPITPPYHIILNKDDMKFSLFLGCINDSKRYAYNSILLLNFYAFHYEYEPNKYASVYKLGEITSTCNPIELSELMTHISAILDLGDDIKFYPICLSINLGFEHIDKSLKEARLMGYILDDLEDKGHSTITSILRSNNKNLQIHRQSDNPKPDKKEKHEKKQEKKLTWKDDIVNRAYRRGDSEMYVVYDEDDETFIKNCDKLIEEIPINLQTELVNLSYDDVVLNCYKIDLGNYRDIESLSNIQMII